MVPSVSLAYQQTPRENSGETYAPPAWALESAAAAPRISPADTGPLVAIFAEARAACSAATKRHQERARQAMLDGIGRQWEAAATLPRIPGHDPLVALDVIADLPATPAGIAAHWAAS